MKERKCTKILKKTIIVNRMENVAYLSNWHKKGFDSFLSNPKFGAENETRTRDPNLGKVVLYQLSYFRMCLVPKVGLEPTRSQ